jgi:uncharacterized protein (TIGR02611 family)
MFERLRKNWHELERSAPGKRFQERYARRRHASGGRRDIHTWLNIGLGSVIMLAGLLMIPAPGPGWLVTFLGFGLLGSEFAPIARALDWIELRLRRFAQWAQALWRKLPLGAKALLILLAALLLAALGYWLLRWLLDR